MPILLTTTNAKSFRQCLHLTSYKAVYNTSVLAAAFVTSGFLVTIGGFVVAGLEHATFFQNLTSTRAGVSTRALTVYSIVN